MLFKLVVIFDGVKDGKVEVGEVMFLMLVQCDLFFGVDLIFFVVLGYNDVCLLWDVLCSYIEVLMKVNGLCLLYVVFWLLQNLYFEILIVCLFDLKGYCLCIYNVV